MKSMKLAAVAALLSIGGNAIAQDIDLPAPDMNQDSKSMIETLRSRHSVREFSEKPLDNQQLSNLCWAACGVSRDNSRRTAPSALNRKEIRVYAFMDSGVYEYLAVENILKQVTAGDHRKLVAGPQAFAATAPVVLVMVIDFERFGSQDERAVMMGCVDAGNVSENINLYCESVGLCTVPRATMDTNSIRELLKLTDKQLPIMNNPVGFPKE